MEAKRVEVKVSSVFPCFPEGMSQPEIATIYSVNGLGVAFRTFHVNSNEIRGRKNKCSVDRIRTSIESFGKRQFGLGVRVEEIERANFRRLGVGVVIPSILDASFKL